MVELQDIHHKPTMNELRIYIANPLFDAFYEELCEQYQVLTKIEYSKDSLARGWNIKLRKAGRGLCVIYPKQSYFTVLIVISNKEKEHVEELLSDFSEALQDIYLHTKEGNGQRWLMIDLYHEGHIYEDVLQLIHIRRYGK